MKETIDLLGKILTNILTALYEPFGFSLLLSFLAMFFYLYDGRSYSMKDMLKVHGPHKPVTEKELEELEEYVLSL